MERGGSHPRWGTENALIVLGDGTYLELLAIREGADTDHRLWRRPDGTLRARGTFGAFALGVRDLPALIGRLRSAGVPFGDPQPGTRLRPDGQPLEWRLSFADLPELPFLIEDVTPRLHRVPPPPPGSLNAAAALARVSIVSHEPLRAQDALGTLLNAVPIAAQGTTLIARAGGGEIALRPGSGVSEGSGIEAITLRIPKAARGPLPVTDSGGQTWIAPEACGGLQIALTGL